MKVFKKMEYIKRCIAIGLCVSLMAVGFEKSVIGTATFYAIAEKKEKSNWCWIASARGAARAETTVTASQSAGVRAVIPQNVIELLGTDDLSGGENEIIQAAKFYSPNSDFILYERALTLNQIMACINNGHLVIALFPGIVNVKPGHALFVIGYNTNDGAQQVRYCETENGLTYWCDYNVFCNNICGSLKYEKSIFCRLK